MSFKFIVMIILGTSFFLFSVPAAASDKLEKRLNIIEKQLRAVQRKVFKKSDIFKRGQSADTGKILAQGTGFADLEARLAQIETELRILTGKIEESDYRMRQLNEKLEAFIKDSDFRFSDLETKNKTMKKNTEKPSAKILSNSVKKTTKATSEISVSFPKGTVMEHYNYAYGLIRKKEYKKAEMAFTEFLLKYPKDKLAGNAQFWLGQTYYVRKMYDEASRAFINGYEKYPKSAKVPSFLLKIGMSLGATGDKDYACGALSELQSSYPNSPENKKLRPSVAKKIGCK